MALVTDTHTKTESPAGTTRLQPLRLVFTMFALVAPWMETAGLSTPLRSGRDDKSIAQHKLVISTGA
jgi:hypothetical protein